MAEIEEELKSILMRVTEESEKNNLKLNIQKKLRLWHPGPSLNAKLMGKKWKLAHFIFLGSKITVNGDCSQDIERCLIFERKAMTNLENMLEKQGHHFANKDLNKVMVFPAVMYRLTVGP